MLQNPSLPQLGWVTVQRQGNSIHLPYMYREGTTGPALMFVHGLGGAKENFYAAYQSAALAQCTLLSFDFPGTGLAEFDPASTPDVSSLAELAHLVRGELLPKGAYLVAASMGGLIALLMLRHHGTDGVRGFVNIEGNLAPEDCMFSRRVTSHTVGELTSLFRQIQTELQSSRFAGDQMIAHNMALNVDRNAYFTYSAETVRESDSGRLLEEFVRLPMPRLFLYGEANKSLSYLPRLRLSDVTVREIRSSAHFLFYDNPVQTFEEVGRFVNLWSRV